MYQAAAAKGVGKITVPPRRDAVFWEEKEHEPHPRNENLRRIWEEGRKEWKIKSGYHRRSLAETAMFRFKTIFGDHNEFWLSAHSGCLRRRLLNGNPDLRGRDRRNDDRDGLLRSRETGLDRQLHEMPVDDNLSFLHSDHPMEVSIGLATLNSLIQVPREKFVEMNARETLLQHGKGKKVVTVGQLPFTDALRSISQ